MGGRRAEERQDRVAHETGHRALVSNDRRDEMRERLVHDVGPVLGVELLGHRGRSAYVAEEHRDHAPLSGPRSGGGGRIQALPAGIAEPRALGVARPAGGAARHGANDSRPGMAGSDSSCRAAPGCGVVLQASRQLVGRSRRTSRYSSSRSYVSMAPDSIPDPSTSSRISFEGKTALLVTVVLPSCSSNV